MTKIKKYSIICILLIFFLCSLIFILSFKDPHFEAEKCFWYAQKTASKILKQNNNKIDDINEKIIINEYKKVVNAAPLDSLAAKSQFIIANIYLRQKKYEKSLKELKLITQNFSTDMNTAPRAYFLMGKIFEKIDDIKQAYKVYDTIIELYPLSSLGLEMPLFLLQFSKKHNNILTDKWTYERVKRHYQTFIEEYKGTTKEKFFQNFLFRAFFEKEAWDDAINFLDDQMGPDSKIPDIMKSSLTKARLYAYKLKKITEAIQICDDLITKFPDDNYTKYIHLKIAEFLLMNKEYEKAKEKFEYIITSYKDNTDLAIKADFGLIEILKLTKKESMIVKALLNIPKKYPNSLQSISIPFLIFRFYKNTNDKEMAEKYLEKALLQYESSWKKEKDEKKLRYIGQLLVICYSQKSDWKNAVSFIDKFFLKYPKDLKYLFIQASIYKEKMKSPYKAKEIYKKILKLAPNDIRISKSVKQLLNDIEKNTAKNGS